MEWIYDNCQLSVNRYPVTLTVTDDDDGVGTDTLTVTVNVPPDLDGDGVPDRSDKCPAIKGKPEYQGCPVADANYVTLHIVDQQKPKNKCSNGAGSCEQAIEGAEIRVFDRNDAQFVAKYGSKNPSGGIYDQIFENGIGQIGAGTTDANGFCSVAEAKTGDYLAIVKYVDSEKGAIYTGLPKSPGDFIDTDGDGQRDLATKYFQVIKVYKNDGSIQIGGGIKTVLAGSNLEIISPDYATWEIGVNNYVYPFILSSDSDWSVDICAEISKGYRIAGYYDEEGNFVPNTDCVQTIVANETKVVAFQVIDLQSSKPDFKAKFKTAHGGKKYNFELDTPGHRKGKDKPTLAESSLDKIETLEDMQISDNNNLHQSRQPRASRLDR